MCSTPDSCSPTTGQEPPRRRRAQWSPDVPEAAPVAPSSASVADLPRLRPLVPRHFPNAHDERSWRSVCCYVCACLLTRLLRRVPPLFSRSDLSSLVLRSRFGSRSRPIGGVFSALGLCHARGRRLQCAAALISETGGGGVSLPKSIGRCFWCGFACGPATGPVHRPRPPAPSTGPAYWPRPPGHPGQRTQRQRNKAVWEGGP